MYPPSHSDRLQISYVHLHYSTDISNKTNLFYAYGYAYGSMISMGKTAPNPTPKVKS